MSDALKNAEERRKRAGWKSRRGQALTEYALLIAAFLGVLATPLVPDPEGDGLASVMELFIRAFDIYIDSFHSVITLPIP